ncbi:hypothetical protein AB6735_18360 [Mucilaginibacter sp. RCC_168]|uniref:hypothetical protein n=1 Tax=Mucilaginibacter sp. RCC_168 TaxID=3239221 RepID=UPI00352484C6
MQKITTEFIKTFIISHNIAFVATQPKLCVPIISRMCQKMSHGIKFDEIKVCDNLIIDGHHRYLSALIMDFELGQVLSNSTSATKKTAWNLVEFDEEDWDTQAKIAYLNKLDAKYNKLEIEFVNQILLDE